MNKKTEIEYLKDRSLAILDIASESENEDENYIEKLKEILMLAYNKGDLRALRTASRDLIAGVKAMHYKDIERVKRMLETRFNEVLDIDKPTDIIISNILEKKRIVSSDEYRIVNEYLADVIENDKYYDKKEVLETLLADYVKRINN